MYRAFHPPDTLSKDEIRTIADVRRDIWTQGFYGMAGGSASGIFLHTMVAQGKKRNLQWLQQIPLNKNTRMASFFLGGSIGALVLATTAGKNSVHNLHPIFEVGSKKQDPLDKNNEPAAEEWNDQQARHRNRLYRRASLSVRT